MAGAMALVACTQYFVAEAISAAAWHDPPYSYARNFISDLGMPDCPSELGGRIICSPLAGVMNTAFLIEGALVVLAVVLLSPVLVGRSWRVAATVLSLVHALGVAMVGIWHASALASGATSLHLAGASMAIMGGNVAIAVVGVAAWRSGAPGWFALLSVALGLLGLGSVAALSSTQILPPGILERLAVDSISAWKITTGLLLAFALAQRRLEPVSRVEARDLRSS